MMGHRTKRFKLFTETNLDALVPADHFYRRLEDGLDLSFVRDLVRDLYGGIGRPSIDPVVFFKLELIAFFEGITSERHLMATAQVNLAHRWYLGYDLDEPLPDHSSLSKIRSRYGLAAFHAFFERIVELCVQAGLVEGEELYLDATKVDANASMHALRTRLSVVTAREHVEQVFVENPVPDDLPADGEERSAPREMPDGTDAAAPDQACSSFVAQVETFRHARRSGLRQNQYVRQSDFRYSPSDPDASLMRSAPGTGARLGYHDHYVVDGGKARIILGALVTPAVVMENTPMLDLVRRARFRWHLHPRQATGDTTYGTLENIVGLEDDGIRALVPLPDFSQRTPYFPADAFTYDDASDRYICPQGQALPLKVRRESEGVLLYRAPQATCDACPAKSQCTPSRSGRQVFRSMSQAYLDKVKSYHLLPEYERAMRKRKVWLEPLFGEAKELHGLRRFRLRGLHKVNMEGLIVAAGQNLKRLLHSRGTKRWPTPARAATLLHFLAPSWIWRPKPLLQPAQ